MAVSRHQYSQLTSIQRYIRQWYTPLQEAIGKHHQQEHQKQPGLHPLSHKYYAYISAVPSEKLAILTAYEILTSTLQRGGTVPFAALSINVGEAVEAEFHMQKLLSPKRITSTTNPNNDDTSIGTKTTTTLINNNNNAYYKESSLELFFQETLRLDPTQATNNTATTSRKHLSTIQKRIKKMLQSDQDWSTIAKARVGAFLVDCFLQTATFSNSTIGLSSTSKEERAFTHEKKWTNKRHLVGHVTINPKLLKQIVNASQGGNIYLSSPSSELKYQPMVYPPRPWKCSNTNDNYNTATEANSNSKNYKL
jgi:DNA-directed RNA polymerase